MSEARGQEIRLTVATLPDREVRISWPDSATDFLLESTSMLGPSADWTPVGSEPVRENGEFGVVIFPGGVRRFYRLRSVEAMVTQIVETSPAAGDTDVAITREVVVRLSGPLASSTTVSPEQMYAEFGGRKILGRVHISSDREFLTLFHLEPLPASARIRVTLKGDEVRDVAGNEVDMDGDGRPGGTMVMDFDTVGLTPVSGTSVSGRVFASKLEPAPGGSTNIFVNVPLAGVTITVDGMEETMRAVTDAFGNFRLDPAPAGAFFVHIDGRTVIDLEADIQYPELAYYPNVNKKWRSIAGEEVNLGEIYLPLIPAGTLKPVSLFEETVLSFDSEFIAENPQFDGVMIAIPPGALFGEDGNRGGMAGIAPVPPDRLPGPLPEGLPIQDVITIQTDGPGNFDVPVPACFPNLPHPVTGELLPPGASSALWSFNHDTGRFEIVGSATVSADGRLVCTDPGVGILAPGWHGTAPGSTARGGNTESGGGSRTRKEKGTQSHPPACASCGTDPCPQSDDAVDPVYLFSGEFYESVVDLRIKGRGFDFVWSRKYRSQIGPNTLQGNGWDFSYNVSLQRDGSDLLLEDGNSRQDVYSRQTDGTWSQREFFREISQTPEGFYELTFADRARWRFYPIDGSLRSGKLAENADRYGNLMTFEYDVRGRLTRVTDTLGREITVAYNPEGYIESVTDFTDRSVRYEYYDGIEPGGNRGDLKSVTSPVVDGTPNGNDFPNGKKVSYTYSTGYSDERLNHNLLTITDGRRNDSADPTFGQGPYVENVYAPTTDPDDPEFDRVVRQVWGGDLVDMEYVPLLPSAANGGVVMKTIVNDRNGNVKEYFFDDRNRAVRKREFTGRADPREPTTDLSNRPAGRLRSSDPEFFETIYEWNEDSLMRREIRPNGNIVEYEYEGDLNPAASPRSRGNLRIKRMLPGRHEPVGEQAVLEEFFEYDTDFQGACCGFNFVTRHVDSRGNETTSEYDEHGNKLRTIHRIQSVIEEWEYNEYGQVVAHILPDNGTGVRRRDEYTYYEDGHQRGYLHDSIRDAAGLALVTTYEYDLLGNVIRRVDPRGNDTRFVLNALDQVVREVSREVVPDSGIRYSRDFFFDANNNVIRIDLENRDANGTLLENPVFTTSFEFEILNHVVRQNMEVAEGQEIVLEFDYDGNRNRIATRFGESVAGRQPANGVLQQYDERDRLFRTIRGPGSADQTTTQHDYDGNGNLVAIREGLEANPRVTKMVYDGFDRRVRLQDAMGNVTHLDLDPNGNPDHVVVTGENRDESNEAGEVRLAESFHDYDELNRLVREERLIFDAESQTAIGDGVAITRFSYNGHSQLLEVVNDNDNRLTMDYDSANRLASITDAAGNSSTYHYDENGNLVEILEIEQSDLGRPEESFRATFTYDNLNRLVASEDNLGHRLDYAYDSRGNVLLQQDALRNDPDGPGNLVTYEYDGLNRLVRTVHFLTSTGAGDSNPIAQIETLRTYDDSSRLVSQTDDLGNRTLYAYDSLNRLIEISYADNSKLIRRYDVHHNVVEQIDPNNSVVQNSYDRLDRLVWRQIEPGPGVAADTTWESFVYDGLSRLVESADDDTILVRRYDSLSRILDEQFNGRSVRRTYDGVGNLLRVQLPGGRTIDQTFDALERLKSMADQDGLIAEFAYRGEDRLEMLTFGNGVEADYSYDGDRRPTRIQHHRANGDTVMDRAFAWDAMDNRLASRNGLPEGFAFDYRYDSLYRLIESTVSLPGGTMDTTSYILDGVGNRMEVRGGMDPGPYTQSGSLPEPADRQVNQYSSTPVGDLDYDRKGNLTRISKDSVKDQQLTYDYANRLTSFTDNLTGVTTRYIYDTLGRRIARQTDGAGAPDIIYSYLEWQVCEEATSDGEVLATYVYGEYPDEILSMRHGGRDYYYHRDDQNSVFAVTDADGRVVETYEYDDFGEPAFFGPSGEDLAGSAIGNPYLFTGRRWDRESGLYYLRMRYLHPRLGRFISRDPIGMWGDAGNLGNAFTYTGNNPATWTDPMGLIWNPMKWAWTGDGYASDEDYDRVIDEAAGIVWDSLMGMGSETIGRVSDWKPSVVIDQREYLEARCRARCAAVKYADMMIMDMAANVPGVGYVAAAPVEPINWLATGGEGEWMDTDPDDLASSAAAGAGRFMQGRGQRTRRGLEGEIRRNERKLTQPRPAGRSRRQHRQLRRQWSRKAANAQRQLESMPKKARSFRPTGQKGRGMGTAGGFLMIGGMVFEVRECVKDCEKNPCMYGNVAD